MIEKPFNFYFNNIIFEIITCGFFTVGINTDKVKYFYDWNSSPQNPFLDLMHHRLYYVVDGHAVMETKLGHIEMLPNHLYFIPSGTIISTSCDKFMNHCALHFTENSPLPNLFSLCDSEHIVYDKNLSLKQIFKDLDHSYHQESVDALMRTQGYLRLILAEFLKKAHIPNNLSKFVTVLDYINDNFHKKIELTDLAQIMNLDPTYFSNLFSNTLGVPPMHFLMRKRLSISQSMLLNPNISIKEVSLKCGFSDQLYFSKLFKEKLGLSPLEFKKRFIKKNQQKD